MYKQLLNKLMSHTLTESVAGQIAEFMFSDAITELQIASLLTAMKFRSETFELMSGFSQVMRRHALAFEYHTGPLIDVCGTGGDGHNTFNISTATSLLLASVMPVAKHGNGSVSSNCGSADVLSTLRIPFHDKQELIQSDLNAKQYAFLYAPLMHQKMGPIMTVRRALKIPTIFNVIGPLCNPIPLTYQIIGVNRRELMEPMAKVLIQQGILKGAVVHGHQHMDELSLSGPNHVIYIEDNQMISDIIDPLDLGLERSNIEAIKGYSREENAEIIKAIFRGEKGPHRDSVVLNCALALYVSNHCDSLCQGVKTAQSLIDSGVAMKQLQKIGGVNDYTR